MAELNATMSDAERQVLIENLNKETEKYIAELKEKNQDFKYVDDTDILSYHPAFLNDQPTQEEIDNNPLLKGLQDLKYDPDDTPYDKAIALKQDGNFQFKHKKYKFACAAYTEAIKTKCNDKELLNILYTNRAASNFHLKNHRSALLDAMQAVKLDPNRVKSLMRCAQCCVALHHYEDAVKWCNIILSLEKNEKAAIEILNDSVKQIKIKERDQRKIALAKERKNKENRALLAAIKSRNIQLVVENDDLSEDDESDVQDQLVLTALEVHGPNITNKVHLDQDGALVWPVLLSYPEYKTTDFIQAFNETSTFYDHISIMFEERVEWDENNDYTPDNIVIFFEDSVNKIYKVPMESDLLSALCQPGYKVRAGTPTFIVLSMASKFYQQFLDKYNFKG